MAQSYFQAEINLKMSNINIITSKIKIYDKKIIK